MRFAIFSLAFDGPVHFGEASQGGGLEQAGMGYPADTLFSALCTELSAEGALADLARLREGVTSGRLLLSDLLPWQVVGDEMAYYLPRPILQLARRAQQPLAYRETCAQATARKRAKKLKYLRASRLADFLRAMQADGRWEEETPEFGAQALTERVNCRGAASLPYFVGTFSFCADAGLYLLAGMEREEDQDWLEALLRWLGCLGIGGKRSSGYGKFHLAEDVLSLDELGLYADDAALYRMLEDAAAPWQMTLSPLAGPCDGGGGPRGAGGERCAAPCGRIRHGGGARGEKARRLSRGGGVVFPRAACGTGRGARHERRP